MALSKDIDTAAGVPATYWRIVRVDVDLKARSIWFVLDGYASAEARTAGKEPIVQKPVTVELPEGVEPETFTRATLYAYVKAQLAEFAGAVDA